ncbi:MAG: thioredoxin domain-containing protein [Planctomycetota bacterium]|jgi:uncharacterized protein|nr:thioredoxin domain-containing protein [Planctomycetota bacterium]
MTNDAKKNPRPANRLAGETSPYLLQHQHNPVDWYPWGDEALERSKAENKPIFLSIGYSACHWCHVMEHESFENEDVAQFMNENFVNIKVDREERPDLDDIYMKATQVLSGHGGWPMSVFLTPDKKPYHAGTYYPLVARYGQPGFPDVLGTMSNAWRNTPDQVEERAEKVLAHVQQLTLSSEHLPDLGPDVERPQLDIMDVAMEQLAQLFDPQHGGFGGPPKFPHGDSIRLALWQHAMTEDPQALRMAEHTLDCMARGGIYDQLGGGFARYSTDGEWAIPHFEKMLYDNALLVPAYLEAARMTGREDFSRVARECCEWVLREMVDEAGGLWSTQDADSEGEEGKFFAWQRDDVLSLVGEQNAQLVDICWGLGLPRNFEGNSWVLLRPKPDEELAAELGCTQGEMTARLDALRPLLFEARDKRIHPGTDDKVLVSWNGLMISALASSSTALGEPRFLAAAQRAADFCLTVMRPDGKRLLATYRNGRAHIQATLADYAYLAAGLLDLFEADGDLRWPRAVRELCDVVREHFADSERAGFFFTADDHEDLVARPRDLEDGALPSSNAVMLDVFHRMAHLTGDLSLRDEADRALAMLEPFMRRAPSAFSRMLLALQRVAAGSPTVVVADGRGADALRAVARSASPPWGAVFEVGAGSASGDGVADLPLLNGKLGRGDAATAYVCRGGTCSEPVTDPNALIAQLGR